MRGGHHFPENLADALRKLKGRTSATSGAKLVDEALDSSGRSLMLIAAVENHLSVLEQLL
eukprot:SAG31_NODE_23071_length_512_cov_0.665860_1_plen_59_part_10